MPGWSGRSSRPPSRSSYRVARKTRVRRSRRLLKRPLMLLASLCSPLLGQLQPVWFGSAWMENTVQRAYVNDRCLFFVRRNSKRRSPSSFPDPSFSVTTAIITHLPLLTRFLVLVLMPRRGRHRPTSPPNPPTYSHHCVHRRWRLGPPSWQEKGRLPRVVGTALSSTGTTGGRRRQ